MACADGGGSPRRGCFNFERRRPGGPAITRRTAIRFGPGTLDCRSSIAYRRMVRVQARWRASLRYAPEAGASRRPGAARRPNTWRGCLVVRRLPLRNPAF
jgi:hypothetical protein